MPRSTRIFKKRSGKIYKKSEKAVTQVENLSPNEQQTCAKERKIHNIDDSFSAENTGQFGSQQCRKLRKKNNNDNNIAVAVDGTWQKRGYTSHNGVVNVTSMDTGKVIDVDVISKYCDCKNKKNHDTSCKSNFRGSSGMMEVKGACNIFKRSLTFHNARYTKYLGDGDSKAFEAIAKENIYGDEFQVEKLECIDHVMKRMGSRLRRVKEKMKGQVLSDDKRISGKNRLTDSQIDKIQNYYGLAIRRNLNSVHAMRQDIWAIFMHKLSTDEKPQHGFCPIGEDSW
ncbi:hypothetical protein AVEN_133113-1 [Araneus ventricosus]|uniref:Mutator-like transposase domain-containing protein n=1 Tax=Araneus ventricosus TaxID=182803 RepID=A0A4Y2PUF4_ARAVE|nr:hypothetical protein AVEN_133113-1 [Araneus ventricosus]